MALIFGDFPLFYTGRSLAALHFGNEQVNTLGTRWLDMTPPPPQGPVGFETKHLSYATTSLWWVLLAAGRQGSAKHHHTIHGPGEGNSMCLLLCLQFHRALKGLGRSSPLVFQPASAGPAGFCADLTATGGGQRGGREHGASIPFSPIQFGSL